jgi:hypothetical protein
MLKLTPSGLRELFPNLWIAHPHTATPKLFPLRSLKALASSFYDRCVVRALYEPAGPGSLLDSSSLKERRGAVFGQERWLPRLATAARGKAAQRAV